MVLRLGAERAELGRPTAAGASALGGRAISSRRQAGIGAGRLPRPHLAGAASTPGPGVPDLVLCGGGSRRRRCRRRWGILFPLAAVCPRPAAGCSPSSRSRFDVRPARGESQCPLALPSRVRTVPPSDHAKVVLSPNVKSPSTTQLANELIPQSGV